MDAYCDRSTKKIVVVIIERDATTIDDTEYYRKEMLRHEITHAFLIESGLTASSFRCDAWAENEEMVDWIAKMHDKLHRAFKKVGAL